LVDAKRFAAPYALLANAVYGGADDLRFVDGVREQCIGRREALGIHKSILRRIPAIGCRESTEVLQRKTLAWSVRWPRARVEGVSGSVGRLRGVHWSRVVQDDEVQTQRRIVDLRHDNGRVDHAWVKSGNSCNTIGIGKGLHEVARW